MRCDIIDILWVIPIMLSGLSAVLAAIGLIIFFAEI